MRELSRAIKDLADIIDKCKELKERYFSRVHRDQMLIKSRIKEIISLQMEIFDLNING